MCVCGGGGGEGLVSTSHVAADLMDVVGAGECPCCHSPCPYQLNQGRDELCGGQRRIRSRLSVPQPRVIPGRSFQCRLRGR